MDRSSKTKELLIRHYQTYPSLETEDIFKYLFQSAFGCEHLVSSEERVLDYIISEYKSSVRSSARIEELDGDYCRAHLSLLDEGLSPRTLARLFFLSAKREEQGVATLEASLTAAR